MKVCILPVSSILYGHKSIRVNAWIWLIYKFDITALFSNSATILPISIAPLVTSSYPISVNAAYILIVPN